MIVKKKKFMKINFDNGCCSCHWFWYKAPNQASASALCPMGVFGRQHYMVLENCSHLTNAILCLVENCSALSDCANAAAATLDYSRVLANAAAYVSYFCFFLLLLLLYNNNK